MGPRERGAAARHSQIFIPEETPRSCCCGRAAGPCAVAALLAALALATMETPAEEDRAEPASPQTPPLNVPPRLDDLQRQLQSLENRIQSLEVSFADLLRILIGSTIERRAAQPCATCCLETTPTQLTRAHRPRSAGARILNQRASAISDA